MHCICESTVGYRVSSIDGIFENLRGLLDLFCFLSYSFTTKRNKWLPLISIFFTEDNPHIFVIRIYHIKYEFIQRCFKNK